MTWSLTAEVAVLALLIGVSGYLYARHLARDFDRRYGGPKHPAE
jgi:hypothetical protein